MTRVAIATTSAHAAEAGRRIAEAGGNAVDAAVAAALVTVNTEPGVCALAGGAYVTVWAPDRPPVTIDGNHSFPGRGLEAAQRGRGAVNVTMEYGVGISTLVGVGSVAIPGALAAFERAWQDYGRMPWRDLLDPAIAATRAGFPLSSSCRYYLNYSGDVIFGRSVDGYRALHAADGSLYDAGTAVTVPHLADSLQAIAEEGAALFYQGELGQKIADHVRAGDGALTREDLATFEAIVRPAMISEVGGWQIATNPPPAVGGSVLTAMLIACADLPAKRWDRASLDRLVRTYHACLDYRRDELDFADDIAAPIARLLDAAGSGQLLSKWSSSSTVHTSAVDDNGIGCAITASAGYGSGEMPAGTGLWLNNGLGEIELNRRGLVGGEPGQRLPSNMAPSVARRMGHVLAIGSPGADRITSALHQTLVNLIEFGMTLEEAIAHPRLHVDTTGDVDTLAVEPGLDLPTTEMPIRKFDSLNMYFGGVGAALCHREDGFEVASDPRREGGVSISGCDD
jgi:gamma-glutamyltranspeptidase/glutathione hydrolase